jgi:DNA-binding response OmpR family regulator
MDLSIPGCDGCEATRRIKSEIRDQESGVQRINPKIIIVSASILEEERKAALDAGCDEFLLKPFQQHVIFELLQKHLGVRFVYENSPGPVAGPKPVLTAETLATLPHEILAELQDAAHAIDLDTVNQYIAQVRLQNEPLADALTDLVKRYRFDILQKLVEEAGR